MALANRPKPTSHDRKRNAQHHVHGKRYLKTYWPYLPVAAIVSVGTLLSSLMARHTSLTTHAVGSVVGSEKLTSLQAASSSSLLNINEHPVVAGAILVSAVAFIMFCAAHWLRISRLLAKGEAYVIKRPWFEIGSAAIFTFGFIVTRAIFIVR
jgi:hypothetical protein